MVEIYLHLPQIVASRYEAMILFLSILFLLSHTCFASPTQIINVDSQAAKDHKNGTYRDPRNGFLGLYYNPQDPISRLAASAWEKIVDGSLLGWKPLFTLSPKTTTVRTTIPTQETTHKPAAETILPPWLSPNFPNYFPAMWPNLPHPPQFPPHNNNQLPVIAYPHVHFPSGQFSPYPYPMLPSEGPAVTNNSASTPTTLSPATEAATHTTSHTAVTVTHSAPTHATTTTSASTVGIVAPTEPHAGGQDHVIQGGGGQGHVVQGGGGQGHMTQGGGGQGHMIQGGGVQGHMIQGSGGQGHMIQGGGGQGHVIQGGGGQGPFIPPHGGISSSNQNPPHRPNLPNQPFNPNFRPPGYPSPPPPGNLPTNSGSRPSLSTSLRAEIIDVLKEIVREELLGSFNVSLYNNHTDFRSEDGYNYTMLFPSSVIDEATNSNIPVFPYHLPVFVIPLDSLDDLQNSTKTKASEHSL